MKDTIVIVAFCQVFALLVMDYFNCHSLGLECAFTFVTAIILMVRTEDEK